MKQIMIAITALMIFTGANAQTTNKKQTNKKITGQDSTSWPKPNSQPMDTMNRRNMTPPTPVPMKPKGITPDTMRTGNSMLPDSRMK